MTYTIKISALYRTQAIPEGEIREIGETHEYDSPEEAEIAFLNFPSLAATEIVEIVDEAGTVIDRREGDAVAEWRTLEFVEWDATPSDLGFDPYAGCYLEEEPIDEYA